MTYLDFIGHVICDVVLVPVYSQLGVVSGLPGAKVRHGKKHSSDMSQI